MGILLASLMLLSSCYHAQITTGAQPSGQVIDKPWAHSFIFGIVPPDEVSVANQCPNGVAKVETQHSFLNGLVAAITFNLYTPIQITVTCAAGSGMSDLDPVNDEEVILPRDSDKTAVIDAIQRASQQSVSLQKPVYVTFQ